MLSDGTTSVAAAGEVSGGQLKVVIPGSNWVIEKAKTVSWIVSGGASSDNTADVADITMHCMVGISTQGSYTET